MAHVPLGMLAKFVMGAEWRGATHTCSFAHASTNEKLAETQQPKSVLLNWISR